MSPVPCRRKSSRRRGRSFFRFADRMGRLPAHVLSLHLLPGRTFELPAIIPFSLNEKPQPFLRLSYRPKKRLSLMTRRKPAGQAGTAGSVKLFIDIKNDATYHRLPSFKRVSQPLRMSEAIARQIEGQIFGVSSRTPGEVLAPEKVAYETIRCRPVHRREALRIIETSGFIKVRQGSQRGLGHHQDHQRFRKRLPEQGYSFRRSFSF